MNGIQALGMFAAATAVGTGVGLGFAAANAHEVNKAIDSAPTMEAKIKAAQGGAGTIFRLIPTLAGIGALWTGGLLLNGAAGAGRAGLAAAIMGAGAGIVVGSSMNIIHPNFKVTEHTTLSLDPWK